MLENIQRREFDPEGLTQNLTIRREYPAMKILALDLGKYKTVGCAYDSETGAHEFQRTFTTPAVLEGLVQEVKPDRVMIEICSIAGWLCDLMGQLGIASIDQILRGLDNVTYKPLSIYNVVANHRFATTYNGSNP
jgi:hypothetical protein